MANSYYPAPSSANGAPVFTVPVQTTGQVPVLPPAYSMAVAPRSSDCDCSFNKKNAIWLSCMLIVAGVMGIIGTAIGLYAFAHLAEIGTGIWCGFMFLATGCVGIAAGHHMTIRLMKATVAAASLTLFFTLPLLTISIVGVKSRGSCWQFCYNPYNNYYCPCYSWEDEALAANTVLIAAASGAFVFSLWLLIIASMRLRSMSKNAPVSHLTVLTSPQLTSPQLTSPQFQQVVGSNPQQPIVIFSNHNQPTLFLGGQQMPQGLTPQQPQAQPLVIMGQQQPFVIQGSQQQQQPQPVVVFRQESSPQGVAEVNVQSPGAVYVQNPAANGGEPGRHGKKNGNGDEAGLNV